jgi:hypothetical protein
MPVSLMSEARADIARALPASDTNAAVVEVPKAELDGEPLQTFRVRFTYLPFYLHHLLVPLVGDIL